MSGIIIAKSFTESNARLSAADRGRVRQLIEKLGRDPSQPSLGLERIRRAADPECWAGRISQNLRVILHRNGDAYTLRFAGHHDDAYRWAERHRLERHTVTGAVQIVETAAIASAPLQIERSSVEERSSAAAPSQARSGDTNASRQDGSPSDVSRITAQEARSTPHESLFAAWDDATLLGLGLPLTWLPAVRGIASDDALLDVLGRLPEEAAEGLLALATGEPLQPPLRTPPEASVLQNPDSRRRFWLVDNDEVLQRILEAPLAIWACFLHPSQRRLAEGRFNGPAKVTGSAGRGKTIVALHRARHLARQGRRVLLTSFVTTLCENLQQNLRLLCSDAELRRITAATLHSRALALLNAAGEHPTPLTDAGLLSLIERARAATGCPFGSDFLLAEWTKIVRGQEIDTWVAYRAASRAGRGRPLGGAERRRVWDAFERIFASLSERATLDFAGICRRACELVTARPHLNPFDAVIVDEVQDLGPAELRLVAALGGNEPDGLMLCGDAGQRIYQQRFSLRNLGIAVRGRSHVLRVNYRTTEQIRRFAGHLFGPSGDDLDGGEERRTCLSLRHGPEPIIRGFAAPELQYAFVAEQIRGLLARDDGLLPAEIAIFAPTNRRVDLLKHALDAAGIAARRIGQTAAPGAVPAVCVTTMHRAKWLEFKAVFVVDAADDLVPSPSALRAVDREDREDLLSHERNLLYVSLTRARDQLCLTWSGRPSRFLSAVSREA
jgi:hypothetical protein